MLEERTIESAAGRGSRRVWVQGAGARRCFLFLDGEIYLQRVGAPPVMGELGTSVYLSFGEAANRHVDFVCREEFSAFLVEELLPSVGSFEEVYLCGLSLSGLAAAFTVLRYPEVFKGALCQSPSAWWNGEWLAANVPVGSSRFWVSVGTLEVEAGVTHAPSGTVQAVSQLDSCRRLAGALRGAGHTVGTSEFAGGHDPVCWAADLPAGVGWLVRGA